jgi:hypothetical protein
MFANIHTLPNRGDWTLCLEGAYLEAFFIKLRRGLGRRFETFDFHILHHNLANGPLRLPNLGKNNILIWLSDESSALPDDIPPKFELILKSYHLPKSKPRNVLPFPLCGCSQVIKKEPIPFFNRSTSVFFAGNLNKNRLELFCRIKFSFLDKIASFPKSTAIKGIFSKLARKLPLERDLSNKIPKSRILFNKSFRSGFDEKDYAAFLADSKICLCPKGFHTSETIRHFEAMRLGCVIISEPLPDSPFYKHSPIIELPSWQNLRQNIERLLSNPEQLGEASRATLNWWHTRISPKAVAENVEQYLHSIS